MTQFEFLMAFASVILAVALTEILGGWGKLARSKMPIRWSGLWVGWSLLIVALSVMYWSGMWPYRDQSFREGFKIFWLAIPTFFLVVLSYLLSPEPQKDEVEVDLEARYWRISPRMFPLFSIFFVCSAIADTIIMGGIRESGVFDTNWSLLFGTVLLALLVASGLTKRSWLHWTTLVLMSVAPLRFLFSDFGAIFR